MNLRPFYQLLSWLQFFKHVGKLAKGDAKPLLRYYARRTAMREQAKLMKKVGL